MSEQGQSVTISGSVCLYHNHPTPPCSADAAVHGVYTNERGWIQSHFIYKTRWQDGFGVQAILH